MASDRAARIGARLNSLLPSAEIARVPKPCDRLPQAFAIGPGGIAELALRLGRGEDHAILSHAQPVQCHEGLPSRAPGRRLGEPGERIERRAGDIEPWRTPADDPGDGPQHLGKGGILPAEYVELAHAATLEGGEMAPGHILH